MHAIFTSICNLCSADINKHDTYHLTRESPKIGGHDTLGTCLGKYFCLLLYKYIVKSHPLIKIIRPYKLFSMFWCIMYKSVATENVISLTCLYIWPSSFKWHENKPPGMLECPNERVRKKYKIVMIWVLDTRLESVGVCLVSWHL